MTAVVCDSDKCEEDSAYRIFWPGREPTFMCEVHMQKAQGISRAMGFHLHIELAERLELL